MDIVGGLDVHRKQITFDYVEMDSAESHRGEIRPADREHLRDLLDEFTERFGEQSRPPSPLRPQPAGATSSKNFRGQASRRTWQSLRTPKLCRGVRSGPRPTASMRSTSEICS